MQRLLAWMARWYPLALLASAVLAMLIWSWGMGPDILVDFGRELYVPWRLSEGQVLYRDIAYMYGPLSPYLNVLWFKLQGVSLESLVLGNCFILIGLVVLLYHLLKAVSSRLAATAAGLVFLTLFAFAQYVGIGNYNFMCPYSHEVTHGLVLALAGLAALHAYALRRGPLFLFLTGLALGATFLTKHEVMVAAALATAAGLAAILWTQRPTASQMIQGAGALLGGAMIPPVTALLLLWAWMPLPLAFRGILGPYPFLFNPELASLRFFSRGSGLEDAGGNLARIGLWVLGYALVGGVTLAASLAVRRWRNRNWVVPVTVFVVAFVVLLALGNRIHWMEAVRPLPVFMLIVMIVAAAMLWRKRGAGTVEARLILAFMLGVFALAMLLKMLLFTRIFQYGFVMAMPASLLLVVAGLCWLPRWVQQRGGDGRIFAAVWLAMLLAAGSSMLHIIHARFQARPYVLATSQESIRTDQRGGEIARVLDELATSATPQQTLTVVPEGVMLNFLARRSSPVPYTSFLPPDLAMFGEDHMLESFRAHPPDFIAWVPREMSEDYGLKGFGIDTGRQLSTWILANYRPTQPVTTPDGRFHIILLRRVPVP